MLIGNGMAGIRTVEELLKLEPEMYDITVIADEPYGNYKRHGALRKELKVSTLCLCNLKLISNEAWNI